MLLQKAYIPVLLAAWAILPMACETILPGKNPNRPGVSVIIKAIDRARGPFSVTKERSSKVEEGQVEKAPNKNDLEVCREDWDSDGNG